MVCDPLFQLLAYANKQERNRSRYTRENPFYLHNTLVLKGVLFMKILLSGILLVLLTFTAHAGEFSYNGIKPTVIIDVRTPQEFAAGHIDGALNIPFDQIGEGILTVKALKKNSTILVYCRSGRRSAVARSALEQLGYKRILDGGGMETLSHNLKACTPQTC